MKLRAEEEEEEEAWQQQQHWQQHTAQEQQAQLLDEQHQHPPLHGGGASPSAYDLEVEIAGDDETWEVEEALDDACTASLDPGSPVRSVTHDAHSLSHGIDSTIDPTIGPPRLPSSTPEPRSQRGQLQRSPHGSKRGAAAAAPPVAVSEVAAARRRPLSPASPKPSERRHGDERREADLRHQSVARRLIIRPLAALFRHVGVGALPERLGIRV